MTNIFRMRSRSGKALPVILAVCVVVSIALGVGVGFVMSKKASASAETGKHGKKEHEEEVEPALVYSLGEMVVNLSDTDTLRYAKLTVAVGLKKKLDEEKLKEMTPVMRDAVINVLTQKSFAQLHKPGGTKAVKKEILEAIEHQAHGTELTRVYFEGFAMQ